MSQALGNVLRNAIQHTQAGGHVVLRGELGSDVAAVITVMDDGDGIHTGRI